MKEKTLEELKREIDALDQYEMCRLWRFAPAGHPYFQGDVGTYFTLKLREKGGMTPDISKSLGFV